MKHEMPMDVPATSPYYDRIQSLKRQLLEAKPSTPEYQWIDAQLYELAARAKRRLNQFVDRRRNNK